MGAWLTEETRDALALSVATSMARLTALGADRDQVVLGARSALRESLAEAGCPTFEIEIAAAQVEGRAVELTSENVNRLLSKFSSGGNA